MYTYMYLKVPYCNNRLENINFIHTEIIGGDFTKFCGFLRIYEL